MAVAVEAAARVMSTVAVAVVRILRMGRTQHNQYVQAGRARQGE